MVQKTHKHSFGQLAMYSWPVFPFKYKYRITARYSTFDEKLTIASLAMFDIQYLMSDWHDKGAIFAIRPKTCIETRHENFGCLGQLEMGKAGYLLTCPLNKQDGKQCRSEWNCSLWAISSGSTLYALVSVRVYWCAGTQTRSYKSCLPCKIYRTPTTCI